jgi:hypothetical protein
MADSRLKNRNLTLLLMIVLISGRSYCVDNNQTLPVYTIRFGQIAPPVVAQQDITVSAPVSNQQTDSKPLECSGLAWLDGTLLITSDRHQHLLFTCNVDLATLAFTTLKPAVLIRNEQYLLNDVESMTVLKADDQAWLYMMCSMSNAPNGQPLPQRRYLLGCPVEQVLPFKVGHRTVLRAGTLRRQLEACFETIDASPYYAYNADPGEDKNTYRWGNVEGITFAPDGKTLLCGMRNPVYADAAFMFTVAGVSESIRSMQPDLLTVTDLFLLDLGGRGISDLCWDPQTEGYLITAARSNGPRLDPDRSYPPVTLDSALFWWSGNKQDSPVLIAQIPDMTIEAVCRLGDSRYIALGSDEGDVSEGRTARQSIITVLDFTGIPQRSRR